MSAGRPVVLANVTLCPTAPNTKLTVVPTVTVSGEGLNVLFVFASTVFGGGAVAVVSPVLLLLLLPLPVPLVVGAVVPLLNAAAHTNANPTRSALLRISKYLSPSEMDAFVN